MSLTTARAHIADRTVGFTESVIRDMTRQVNTYHPDDGINLSQGFPDFPAPLAMKEAAVAAIMADVNQYAITWGAKAFRDAISAKTERFLGFAPDPEREITVTCGATEAMISALLAVVNPGEEVIVFEPFYENYGPDAILCDARPRYVSLDPPDWSFDRERLASAFSSNTTSHHSEYAKQPDRQGVQCRGAEFIADLCQEHDVLAITDEIYEHIVYDGLAHVSMATLPEMRDRTIIVNGSQKPTP